MLNWCGSQRQQLLVNTSRDVINAPHFNSVHRFVLKVKTIVNFFTQNTNSRIIKTTCFLFMSPFIAGFTFESLGDTNFLKLAYPLPSHFKSVNFI